MKAFDLNKRFLSFILVIILILVGTGIGEVFASNLTSQEQSAINEYKQKKAA